MLPFDPAGYRLEDAIIESSQRFRQGHILKGVTVGYGACATSMSREGRDAGDVGSVWLPFAMVVTQTCDIQNPSRMAKIPLLNVVPVYDAFAIYASEEVRGSLRKPRNFRYLVRVDSPADELANGTDRYMVGDLTWDFAVERGVLVGRSPLEAFRSEEDYLAAGRRIGAQRLRAGVDDRVRDHVLKPLRRAISAERGLKKKFIELWLECDGSPLYPRAIRLHLVVDEDVAVFERVVEEWYAGEFQVDIRAAAPGLAVKVPKIVSGAVDREVERCSVLIHLFEDDDEIAFPHEAAAEGSATIEEAS